MKPLESELRREIERLCAESKNRRGPLLIVLHAVQATFGFVPPASIPMIADALNLSRAEVHGVVTFYHYFRQSKHGARSVQICRAEACQSRNGEALANHAKRTLGVDFGETTHDGRFTLENVYCLGNCACGPSMTIDGAIHGRVTPEKFDALVGDVAPRSAGHRTDRSGAGATIYISGDCSALSLGADEVAETVTREAATRKLDVRLVRPGSRGMFWLEPLVEVATQSGRVAYGPVAPKDVAKLFDANFLDGSEHRLRLGLVEEIPYFKKQQRISFARVGVVDPRDIQDFIAHGGFRGLKRALEMKGGDIVKAVTDSGLRGRGGAAFPTGIKWQTVHDQPAAQKYIACNADEGDSGTFADRMLMEGDPFTLIEGMTIAGLGVGATQGFIYLRVEYPHAHRALNAAIESAYRAGYLGDVLGSGKRFDLEVRLGAGAYICGEETSMLESLEGKRGEVRVRPPLPAIKGLFGMPTVVNNVLSFAAVPMILERGADFYRSVGVGKSRGTLPIQLAGNIKRGGLIELAFGVTLRELLYDFGGGSESGRPIRAVQIGGPLGAYIPASQFDVVIDYEALSGIGALLGHGGIVVFDDTVDMARMARYAMEFCAVESCGKCTPCRIGSTRGMELIDRIVSNDDRERNVAQLNDLCETMLQGSLCGLGGMTPFPVQSALKYFADDFLPKPARPQTHKPQRG